MIANWVGNYSKHRATQPRTKELFMIWITRSIIPISSDRRADMLAGFLTNKLGIKKYDRVAFLARNCIELIDAYYATGKVGAILVPYNIRLSAAELIQLIHNEEPKVLFYEDTFKDKVTALKEQTGIRHYVVLPVSSEKVDDMPYEEIFSAGEADYEPCLDLTLNDIHMLLHTGGTTGLPKAAMLSHQTLLFNSFNEIVTWNITHTDSAHILLPLFHTGGWNLLTLPLLHAGGTIIINRQFDPLLALKTIEKEKTTFCFGAATIFKTMIDLPEF